MEETISGVDFVKLFKLDLSKAMFLLSTASAAIDHQRAVMYTEPFPSFMLYNRELRERDGNLSVIQKVQESQDQV